MGICVHELEPWRCRFWHRQRAPDEGDEDEGGEDEEEEDVEEEDEGDEEDEGGRGRGGGDRHLQHHGDWIRERG